MKISETLFAYTGTGKHIIQIPDFSFLNWPECGINDYDSCCCQMIDAGQKKAIYPQLFWIGNVKTHPTRELLCTLAEKDKRIKAIGMNWNRVDKQKTMNGFDTYVSLPDHCQYKYLIDMMGRGWSARTKILMFSGRPLFIQDRKWTEYWYKDIKPFVHYIPVKADLSDLSTQISWAESHQQEAQQIAINAQKFACEYLTREAAINYLKNALIKYINGDCSLNKSSN